MNSATRKLREIYSENENFKNKKCQELDMEDEKWNAKWYAVCSRGGEKKWTGTWYGIREIKWKWKCSLENENSKNIVRSLLSNTREIICEMTMQFGIVKKKKLMQRNLKWNMRECIEMMRQFAAQMHSGVTWLLRSPCATWRVVNKIPQTTGTRYGMLEHIQNGKRKKHRIWNTRTPSVNFEPIQDPTKKHETNAQLVQHDFFEKYSDHIYWPGMGAKATYMQQ